MQLLECETPLSFFSVFSVVIQTQTLELELVSSVPVHVHPHTIPVRVAQE